MASQIERMDTITAGIRQVHGESMAHLAESAAQVRLLIAAAQLFITDAAENPYKAQDLRRRYHELATQFLKDLCDYHKVDFARVIEVSRAYKEVVQDIISNPDKEQ